MANTFNRKILADGQRNAVVMVTGILDTSDAVLEPVLALDELVNNDAVAGNLVGLRVDEVQYSMSADLGVVLVWENGPAGGGDQLIVAIAGQGKDEYRKAGGLHPNTSKAGYVGNVNLSTSGFAVGTAPMNFTVTLSLVKVYG